MKNILIFLQQYVNLICFLLLQVISIQLLTTSSKTHETFFADISNEFTGSINSRYSGLKSYFSLYETNRLLAEENSKLRNALSANFQLPPTTVINTIDTTLKDSTSLFRKYTYLPAEVVSNSFSQQNNYLMLERGAKQGIRKGMAVVSATGIVGVVVETTENFSKVMSLLHRNSRVSAMLKKDHTTGSVEWDGADPSFLILKNITRSTKIVKGDTVLTSNYSANFPSNLMIGTISEVALDPASNYYVLKVKTSTNFYNIQFANAIDNIRYNEQTELENSTKSQ